VGTVVGVGGGSVGAVVGVGGSVGADVGVDGATETSVGSGGSVGAAVGSPHPTRSRANTSSIPRSTLGFFHLARNVFVLIIRLSPNGFSGFAVGQSYHRLGAWAIVVAADAGQETGGRDADHAHP
jgi:hypothetical protein